MPVQSKCFYPFTREIGNRIGEMTSFVWSSYAGLWHIHKAATALSSLSSKPEWKKIEDYLVEGVPERGGIDLKFITSRNWEEHQSVYSDFIMTQAAVLYEEWCGELASMTLTSPLNIKSETFQFPSGATSHRWTNWGKLDEEGVIGSSEFLTSEVRPHLLAMYEPGIKNIDGLLKWYRFYKELRNAKTHHGGILRQENVDAHTEAIKTPLSTLGLKRDYSGAAPIVGSMAKVVLADAVLMLAVIQRLAYAFDAKYCHTVLAEEDLTNRLKTALTSITPPIEALASRKETWLRNFMERHASVTPTTITRTEKWLEAKKLIKIRTI